MKINHTVVTFYFLKICLSAAASVAAETEQCVMYYDTGGAFDVERIHGMLETRQLSKKVKY